MFRIAQDIRSHDIRFPVPPTVAGSVFPICHRHTCRRQPPTITAHWKPNFNSVFGRVTASPYNLHKTSRNWLIEIGNKSQWYIVPFLWLLVRDQARRYLLFLKETNGFRFLLKDLVPYLLRVLFITDFDKFCSDRLFLLPLKGFSTVQILAFWPSCTQPALLARQFFWASSSWQLFDWLCTFKAPVNSQCYRMTANNFSNFWNGQTSFSQYFDSKSLFTW